MYFKHKKYCYFSITDLSMEKVQLCKQAIIYTCPFYKSNNLKIKDSLQVEEYNHLKNVISLFHH